MRKQLLLAEIIILIVACTATSNNLLSVEEILQTNQYLLIAQQDGVTYIQRNVTRGICPLFMSKTKKSFHSDFRLVGIHLIRDPLARRPPLLMIIKDGKSHFSLQMLAPNVTEIFQNSGPSVASFYDKSQGFRIEIGHAEKIKTTLFDSTSHMLYIELFISNKFKMMQYFVQNLFTNDIRLHRVGLYSQDSSSSRYDWEEDHYNKKFYYKEKVDNEIGLFEIPMGALIRTAYEGEAGLKIGSLTWDGTLSGANGGAFYTVNTNRQGNTTTIDSSLVPTSLSAGFRCSVNRTSSEVPLFNKLVIVRNQDYCMLRDGSNYDADECAHEQRKFLGLESEGESIDIVKWLLVTCIIMFMIIILLFVYIYWLRSTFVSDYDRTHPNETEASLFVAKQRSFPSVYQDPALLDVSVDRWN
ncbi:hypothetical protein GCK72_005631 [Caenorhabditis remanei]|uniref:Uncharacterized protein n=1 Tax=Caenorhabditis remanei TaxID=31234 RepID=A0A6A5HD41_CAERE|nr:hypothetical protein GCK72_005631 [Caenorhabditis remanei]KAF1765678.1 hypothetical protein GCK72_005631 [Caenorhabditis remanei]